MIHFGVSLNTLRSPEVATCRCSTKYVFFKILRYSQENTCVGISFLIKLQALRPTTLLKRDSYTGASM